MGCLYKLTSPSGKSYIGISNKTLEARWAKHVEHACGKRNAGALYAALRKYGIESFTRVVLAEADDWGALCAMEIEAIKSHGTLAPGGYNLTVGGEGFVGLRISDKTRAAMSAAQKRRFQDPAQRRLNGQQIAAARASRPKRPPWRKPRRGPMDKVEHSRRTLAAMARPDVKAKILAKAQARAADPSWRAKISAAKKGVSTKPCSEQRRRLISEARKREWADPVIRARRLDAAQRRRRVDPPRMRINLLKSFSPSQGHRGRDECPILR
jgi:group I intron endonuclease